MTYLYRCTATINGERCFKSRSLKKHHTQYIRPPTCKVCGHKLTYINAYQMRKNKENKCNCDAWSFPHRAGSSIMCIGFKGELTQQQINEWHKQNR